MKNKSKKTTKVKPQAISNRKWGFIREKEEQAIKAGITTVNGINIHRTALIDYLLVIFPQIPKSEWHNDEVCDEVYKATGKKIRPDFRCDYNEYKIIVEFDGVQHYKQPSTIKQDKDNQAIYESFGYTVYRIPYFIQLTKDVVKTLFGIDVQQDLFDPTIPSMASKGRNTPAFCCPAGIKRMAEDFKKYPQQYQVNIVALEKEEEFFSGCKLLKHEYQRINKNVIKTGPTF